MYKNCATHAYRANKKKADYLHEIAISLASQTINSNAIISSTD